MKREAAEKLWSEHGQQWRRPAQVVGAWWDGGAPDPRLLRCRTRGPWWDLLEEAGITLLVSREYEHLLLALNGERGKGRITYLALPHPSGIAVDRAGGAGRVMVASTRNPNQIVELRPHVKMLERGDSECRVAGENPRPLVPTRTWFYPGSLYMHDLAYVGGALHGNAVGHNAVVRLEEDGGYSRVWWPASMDREGKAEVNGKGGATMGAGHFERNYLQLNSIAVGGKGGGKERIEEGFFSASTDRIGKQRPGEADFPVDGRGVIFSGATREPMCRGLTRPHSARVHGGKLFVDNSGYGEFGAVADGKLEVIARLPGWTRGLCFVEGVSGKKGGTVAFVGTSQILPRFKQYAPGVDAGRSVCGIHAIEAGSGKIVASVTFPWGNQIFAIDWLPARQASGLPFSTGKAGPADDHAAFFYASDPDLLREP